MAGAARIRHSRALGDRRGSKSWAGACADRVWPAVADDEDISFALEVRAEVGLADLEVRRPAVAGHPPSRTKPWDVARVGGDG
jgi:hypothetical protein